MCTSRRRWRNWGFQGGFTAMELLVGLTLAILLIMAIGPVWLSLERSGLRSADRVINVMQARVAIARFERDLRLASAGDCPFATAEAVLEAIPSQVVVLSRGADDGCLRLVEWEVSAGRLMRRWGWCPAARPSTYENALYVDHKTMLEGVVEGSGFCYGLGDGTELDTVPAHELSRIQTITLKLSADVGGAVSESGLSTTGQVGR